MSVKPNTAATANATAKGEEKVAVAEVPAQKKAPNSVSVDTMIDGLDLSSDMMENGFKVRVVVDGQGNRSLEVVDEVEEQTGVKKLVAGAKGVFNRNKKLVLASAGLLATSVVLKVLAARRVELEADEVVESSDEVSTEA